MQLPEIVSPETWQEAVAAVTVKEKQAMRERDALAAERRRLPAVDFPTHFEFDGPAGRVAFPELFEGRRQLIVYHFWHPPEGEPCTGCSMFADQVGELAHLHARDVTFALVSTAPQDHIQAYKERMGWDLPWYTVVGDEFQTLRDTTEYFKLDVYLRDSDRVLLTYERRARGVEELGPVWSFLDLTPFGRQEEWEETPSGRPQQPPYSWWRKHDQYETTAGR